MTGKLADIYVLRELENLVQGFDPNDLAWVNANYLQPAAASDTMLGIVQAPLARMLWAITCKVYLQAEVLKSQAQLPMPADEKAAKTREASRLADVATWLRSLFWIMVHDELNAWNYDSVGIRRDWVLVQTRSSPLRQWLNALEQEKSSNSVN